MITQPCNRREFITRAVASGTGAALALTTLESGAAQAAGPAAAVSTPSAEKLGWRLGCQAWTFNRFTLHEAIDNTAELGLHYIEAFPHGQKISASRSEQFGPKMSVDARKDVKKYLADKNVKLVNMGVGPYDKEAFEFAKEMGIETLVAEPPIPDRLTDQEVLAAIERVPREFREVLLLADVEELTFPKPFGRLELSMLSGSHHPVRSTRIQARFSTRPIFRNG